MEYKDITEIKVLRAYNEPEINELLAQGWIIITIDTTEYYGGLGPKDVQQKYLVLGKSDAIKPNEI